jgi:glycine/D-amino acid oxidase-like deaminating enzyme
VTPDDTPIVGSLRTASNVYIHNGMGGFGNIAVGTAKVLADMMDEDRNGTRSQTREQFKFLLPQRFDL